MGAIIVADVAFYFLFVAQPSGYSMVVTNMLVPICFAALVQLAVLLPFSYKFTFPPKQNRFGVNFFSFMLLCAPILVSLPLVRKVTAKVITVNNVSEISAQSNDNYYVIKEFSVNLHYMGENSWTERRHRKHGKDYIEMNMRLAAPVTENGKSNFGYWISCSYSHNTKNAVVNAVEFNDFRAKSLNDFKSAHSIQDIVYLEKTPQRWMGEHTLEAINDIMYNTDKKSFVVLEPHYKSLGQEIRVQSLFLLLAFAVNIIIGCLIIGSAKLEKPLPKAAAKQSWTSRNT